MERKNERYRILNGTGAAAIGAAGMKPYNFRETGANTAEVEMYGQVVENRPVDWWTGEPVKGLYIVLAEFLEELDSYREKDEITFRINSVGGDLFAGIAICNRISELAGNTITVVDGLAASAASIILQGGKTRKVFAGSQVMVHGASVFMYGSYNRQDLEKVANRIEGGNRSALETFAARTGKDRDFIKGLMDREEWMTGKEAVENGFVDELVEADGHVKLSMSADGKGLLANGIWMPAEGFRNMPKGIPVEAVATVPVQGTAVIEGTGKKQEETGGKTMDLEELKRKYPELVQQIEDGARQQACAGGKAEDVRAEAVKQERERLKEIGEIENQIADKGLVDDAKFGENPMTAQELAFAAMKRQQETGRNFLEQLTNDAADSGTGEVKPVPNAGTKTPEEQDLEDINNGASLIAAGWK